MVESVSRTQINEARWLFLSLIFDLFLNLALFFEATVAIM
jgi:hypothetical protein